MKKKKRNILKIYAITLIQIIILDLMIFELVKDIYSSCIISYDTIQ